MKLSSPQTGREEIGTVELEGIRVKERARKTPSRIARASAVG